MPKMTITGLGDGDGSYDLDLEGGFTYKENHLIKTVSGVRALEIEEAFTAGDTDLILCFAKIALDRNGRSDVTVERLMELKGTAISVDKTDAEKEAEKEEAELPPPTAPTGRGDTKSKPAGSGDSTSNGSEETPVVPLSATGVHGLGESSASGRVTSQT